MKRFILGFSILGSVVALGAAGVGCGDSNGSGGAGGTGGTGAATSSPSSTTVAMTTSTGGGGMSPGHSFDTALPITIGDMTPTEGMLPDPAMSKDFYKFTGKAGEKLGIVTTAKPTATPFDNTYLDLVVTLYDANQQMIAQQDDPWPRFSNDPQLYTFLPEAGDYYVEVQECNGAFGSGCAVPGTIKNNAYTLQVFDFGAAAGNPVTDGAAETPAAHADDDISTPNTVAYVQSTGKYELSFLDGTFVDGTDIDVYAFTPPADVTVDAGTRANADFWISPAGPKDDGSTSPVGKAWITDALGTTILAQVDGTKYDDEDDPNSGAADLNVPLTADGLTKYFLFVQHPSSSGGANDFYVIQHFVAGGNPVEAEFTGLPGTNDDPTTPEALSMPQTNADGSMSYFIEGDLPTGDVDRFSVPKDSFTKVSATCAGLRIGSGATITYQLNANTGDGTAIGSAVTEVAAKDLSIAAVAIGTATKVVLSVSPASQDATVTSSHYRCGVSLSK